MTKAELYPRSITVVRKSPRAPSRRGKGMVETIPSPEISMQDARNAALFAVKHRMRLKTIGRARLKLRSPAYRKLLAELGGPELDEIFVACAEAALHLDRLRGSDVPDQLMIEEYEKFCLEIEASIEPYLRICPLAAAVL